MLDKCLFMICNNYGCLKQISEQIIALDCELYKNA